MKNVKNVGIQLALVAFFLMVVMNVSVKAARESLPALEVAFLRFALGFVVIFVAHRGWQSRPEIAPGSFKWHLLRSVLGSLAFACYSYAFLFLPLATATALSYVNPLLLAILARLILREHVPPLRWLAIVLGFVGVLLVVKPGTAEMFPAMVLIAGCVAAASGDIVVRKLVGTHTSSTIVLMFFGLSTLLLLPVVPAVWVMPTATQWAWLGLAGLTSGLFQLALTQSFRLIPTSLVAPFSYTSLLWATLSGFLLWGEWPSGREMIGALFIIADGFLAFLSAGDIKPVQSKEK